MNTVIFPLLTKTECSILYDALHYMKMDELKKACKLFLLSELGKKAALIQRIITFIQIGKVKYIQKIPAQSLAKNYPPQSIHAGSLMLYGGYKNDAQTRALFKKLIGRYFHFTAFGIDWLNERWCQGKPPTYQEFADYWVAEVEQRKHKKVEPKKEWAYINFLQHMNAVQPQASKEELMHAWKKLQSKKSQEAFQLLEIAANKLI